MKPTKEEIKILGLIHDNLDSNDSLADPFLDYINRMKADIEPREEETAFDIMANACKFNPPEKKPHEYKVGDRATVIRDTSNHGLHLDSVITISSIDSDGEIWADNDSYFFYPLDLEPIPQEGKDILDHCKGWYSSHDERYIIRNEDGSIKETLDKSKEYTGIEDNRPTAEEAAKTISKAISKAIGHSSQDHGISTKIPEAQHTPEPALYSSEPVPREQYHPSRMDYFVARLMAQGYSPDYAIKTAKEAIKQIDKI